MFAIDVVSVLFQGEVLRTVVGVVVHLVREFQMIVPGIRQVSGRHEHIR